MTAGKRQKRKTAADTVRPGGRDSAGHPAVSYRVDCHTHAAAHLYVVRMVIERPRAGQVVRLPVWIPGSYMVREFARHLQHLSAQQQGEPVAVQQLDKCSWKIRCVAEQPVELSWQVYAFDASVRTAYLDEYRAFFNPTSLCLMAQGLEAQPHVLHLSDTPVKQVATGAKQCSGTPVSGAASYYFADYDTLADTPFEVGAFWSGSFTLHGIRHRLVVTGAPACFDGKRLLRDVKKICAWHLRFWHGGDADGADAAAVQLQMDSYVFMLHASADGYGGLEHRNSTALICRRADLPVAGGSADAGSLSAGYITLLGLVSHEYFHTWNVKRLRPDAFRRYDYFAEQYTQLLWFFEGFTSYYDDLALYRVGLITAEQYLQLLVRALNYVQHSPGAAVQSVAQSSFDAWIKYYRRDHNTPNHTVSYYVKGAVLALCLDLRLRAEGRGTLDTLMLALWQHCQGGTMSEADFLRVLRKQAGKPLAAAFQGWVHGTGVPPYRELLEQHGVEFVCREPNISERLGATAETGSTGQLVLKTVQHGGAAQQAGLSARDELLAVNGWRMRTLDCLLPHAQSAEHAAEKTAQTTAQTTEQTTEQCAEPLALLYARDGRLHTAALSLPPAGSGSRRLKSLQQQDAATVVQWLDGADGTAG